MALSSQRVNYTHELKHETQVRTGLRGLRLFGPLVLEDVSSPRQGGKQHQTLNITGYMLCMAGVEGIKEVGEGRLCSVL